MVTGKDILQGIQAFAIMAKATQPNSHNAYYDYLLTKQQETDAFYKKRFAAGAKGNAFGAGYPPGYGGTAISDVDPAQQVQQDANEAISDGEYAGGYSRGGMIRRYHNGGAIVVPRQIPERNYGRTPKHRFEVNGRIVPHFEGGGLMEEEDPRLAPSAIEVQPPTDPLLDMVNVVAPPLDSVPLGEAEQQRMRPQPGTPDYIRRVMTTTGAVPTTRLLGEGGTSESGLQVEATDEGSEGATSKLGRALAGPATARDTYAIQQQIIKLQRERTELEPGILTDTTRTQRRQIREKQRELDRQINVLGASIGRLKDPEDEDAPSAPTAAGPAVPQPQGPAAAPGDPTIVAGRPQPRTQVPLPAQVQAAADEADRLQRQLAQRARNEPVSAGVSPGPPPSVTSGPVAPAVPPGAGRSASPGVSTPGGMGGAAVAPPPAGALSDPRRVAAFDPATEAGIGAVDTTGRVTQAGNQGADAGGGTGLSPGGSTAGLSSNRAVDDFHQAAVGAHAGMIDAVKTRGLTPQQVQAGVGAASPAATNQILQRYGGGGRLTPGQAMVGGMTAVYLAALERGDTAKAGQYAFAIVQRANVEAAVHGKAAIAALRHGDLDGAAHMLVRGLDWMPDGTRININPDGKSVMVTDVSGKHTDVPIDGRWILQAAVGLQDGSLMWNLLNAHAASMAKGQDKDAEGRALRNQRTRQELTLGDMKIKAGGRFPSVARGGRARSNAEGLGAISRILAGEEP